MTSPLPPRPPLLVEEGLEEAGARGEEAGEAPGGGGGEGGEAEGEGGAGGGEGGPGEGEGLDEAVGECGDVFFFRGTLF